MADKQNIIYDVSQSEMLDDLHITDRMPIFHGIDNDTSHELYQQFISQAECKDFLDWTKSPNALWVSAGPGRGKTMLLMGIARQLSISASETPGKWFLSYHFCGQEGPESDTPATILKSLIKMILRQQPWLVSHLDRLRRSTERKWFDEPNDFAALSWMFYSMIRDEKLVETYLLVDAIDECFADSDNPSFKDIMRLVTTSMALPKIKWLISTCSTTKIEPLIQDGGCFHLDLDLDLNYRLLSATLERHISSKVSELAREKGYEENLTRDIVKEMQARSSRNFLWVEMVCRALQAEDSWYALDVLTEMPDDIRQLYDLMNGRIGEQPRKDPVFCQEVLNTMAIAFQPLQISELVAILDLRAGQLPVDTMNIVRKCSAFLEVRNGVVRFIRGSAKDYLRRNLSADAHANMAKRLLGTLSGTLIEATEPMALRTGQDKLLTSVGYTSIYWMRHMIKIEDIDKRSEIIESATSFLTTLFLQWLYVLGPEWRVTRAAALLLQLEGFLRVRLTGANRTRTLPVIRDAHRLLHFYQSLSGDCPDSYYQGLSTMFYCPGNSARRQAVVSKTFPWILACPAVEDKWRDNFLTLETLDKDSVRCIGFSPDGRLIASGSNHSIVRIWDAQTGTLQHTLHGFTGDVHCLAISTTGLLAQGSDCKSVVLWDYAIGRSHQRKLQELSGPVNAVSFSPDGKYLIAASNQNLYMWDFGTEAGDAQILTGHEDEIRSVAFSHDGSLITSADNKGDIYIWNTESRIILQSINGHDDSINCVVFSPTACQIASGSDDGTMKIWNADTGKFNKSFSAEGRVLSLAFSPCGSSLAMAVCSPKIGLIKVLDTESWKVRREIQGHKSNIKSVSFAPKGRFLASSLDDGTIRFWYDEPNESKQIDIAKQGFQSHQEAHALAMTDDGSCVASFLANTVRLWDGETGQPLQTPTFLDHECTMESPTFSPDKEKLVFGSWKKVCVFYISGNKPLRCFSGHKSGVRATVFSPDSRFIASASNDETVWVWDLEGGENGNPQVLKGDKEGLIRVAFSNDGLYLASAGDRSKVYLWERPSWKLKAAINTDGLSRYYIDSVAFSPDSKRILLSQYQAIEIWDIQNEQFLEQIKLDWTPRRLWSGPRSTDYVMTEHGAQSLKVPFSDILERPEWAPYGILRDEKDQYWITWKNKKVIFIPEKLRPKLPCVRGHTVAVGLVSGDVLIFRFSTETTPLQFPLPQITAERYMKI